MNELERPLVWLGSSRRDLAAFPRQARREIGVALFAAQNGETDPAAKPLKGFGGAAVMEIVSEDQRGAWRAVYTVRFAEAVYVLHAFQKKSKSGISTPKREIELIKRRLSDAAIRHKEGQN